MNSIEDLNIFFEIPDTTVNVLLDNILKNNDTSNKIIVSDNVYTDTNIDEWLNKQPTTIGGMKIMDKIIKTPINNKELLIQRQKSNYELLNYQREILKNNEKDLLWIMTLKDEIDDDLSINLLFPSTYLINKYFLAFSNNFCSKNFHTNTINLRTTSKINGFNFFGYCLTYLFFVHVIFL